MIDKTEAEVDGGTEPEKPQLAEINIDSIIKQLLSVRDAPGRQVQLPETQIRQLCILSRQIFLDQSNLVEMECPINICGDIHGQYEDLLRTFDMNGYPPDKNYLFLGDYVDRGKRSLETICLLLAYKIKYPENFFLLRGNHECASVNRIYGFYDECKRRYNIKLWKTFTDCFNTLPIATSWENLISTFVFATEKEQSLYFLNPKFQASSHTAQLVLDLVGNPDMFARDTAHMCMPTISAALVEGTIFTMHGGLSPDLTSLEQIREMERPFDVPDHGLVCDMLWSDPDEDITGWGENDRGVSYTFGGDIVREFNKKHNLSLIVRAHQVVEDGYQFFQKRQLVTLFGAPNYCGEFDNAAATMIVSDDLTCSFTILQPQTAKVIAGAKTDTKKKK